MSKEWGRGVACALRVRIVRTVLKKDRKNIVRITLLTKENQGVKLFWWAFFRAAALTVLIPDTPHFVNPPCPHGCLTSSAPFVHLSTFCSLWCKRAVMLSLQTRDNFKPEQTIILRCHKSSAQLEQCQDWPGLAGFLMPLLDF